MQEYLALSGGEGLMRTWGGGWGRVELALHTEDLKGRRFGTGMQPKVILKIVSKESRIWA